MGVLGDLSRSKSTDPPKSAAARSSGAGSVDGSDAPGKLERGNDKSVGNVPLRITRERIKTEWEKVPNTDAVSTPHSSEIPGLSSTNEATKQMADEKENTQGGLHGLDLTPRRANENLRLEEQQSRSNQASGTSVYPTTSPSMLARGAHEGEKKAAEEHAVGSAGESGRQRSRSAPKALWAVVALLALALAGMTGYGCIALRQNGIALSQLPGIAQLAGTLDSRLNATETQLRDMTAEWANLSRQIDALSSKMGSSLENVRRHADELIRQKQEQIEAEMAERDQAINTRLAQVESEQQAQNARLAQVQDWIQKNVDVVRQEVVAERQDRERDLKSLRQDVDQNRSSFQAFARRADRQRVDFELAKNKQLELVPGISLTVTRTDARYQRFEGYLELIEDSRTVWLSKVSAQQAVPFYPKQGGRPYDLVVTNVTRDGVVGYLFVPKDESAGTGEAASGALTSGTQRYSGGSF